MKKALLNLPLACLFLVGLGLVLYGMWVVPAQEAEQAEEAVVETDDEIHYHAAFLILLDGEVQQYNSPDQMHIEPCGIEDDHSQAPTAKDRVHLHNQVGNVAHVHAAGVNWGTLLESLEVPAAAEQEWFLYPRIEPATNASTEPASLITELRPFDRMVLSTQPLTAEELAALEMPDRAAIEAIETGTSENCGSN